MDSAATRCPHCQTRFRVTEAQLQTARGLVRCGACLEVFNATEHWVETEPQPEPQTEAKLEQDSEAGAEPKQAGADRAAPQPDVATPPEPSETPASEETTELSEPGADGATSDEPAQEIAAGPETEAAAGDSAAPGTGTARPPEDATDIDSFDELLARKRRSLAVSRQQLTWSALSVLAALALVGQVLYVNFNTIAQSDYRPQLAKTCDVLNFFLGAQRCVLPPPQNLAQIRSRGLNVLSHPDYAESLLVDALIVNTASFAQPFPVIELAFRDRNGRTVASRRFRPAEYLAGELAGQTRMPSGQPVHIRIGILDPGASAVNYEMTFLPADLAPTPEPYTG